MFSSSGRQLSSRAGWQTEPHPHLCGAERMWGRSRSRSRRSRSRRSRWCGCDGGSSNRSSSSRNWSSRGLRPGVRHGLCGGEWDYSSLNWRAQSHFWSWRLRPFNPLLLTRDTEEKQDFQTFKLTLTKALDYSELNCLCLTQGRGVRVGVQQVWLLAGQDWRPPQPPLWLVVGPKLDSQWLLYWLVLSIKTQETLNLWLTSTMLYADKRFTTS